jgi:hypothetical protein
LPETTPIVVWVGSGGTAGVAVDGASPAAGTSSLPSSLEHPASAISVVVANPAAETRRSVVLVDRAMLGELPLSC